MRNLDNVYISLSRLLCVVKLGNLVKKENIGLYFVLAKDWLVWYLTEKYRINHNVITAVIILYIEVVIQKTIRKAKAIEKECEQQEM